jgi:hypothetical protein
MSYALYGVESIFILKSGNDIEHHKVVKPEEHSLNFLPRENFKSLVCSIFLTSHVAGFNHKICRPIEYTLSFLDLNNQ